MNHYDNLLNLSCDTTITTEKDGYYTFAETVFYGEKGGMPGDKGTINGLEVIDLKWEDDVLYHKVDGTLQNPIHTYHQYDRTECISSTRRLLWQDGLIYCCDWCYITRKSMV